MAKTSPKPKLVDRQPELEGAEQIRHADLDRICEDIGDESDQIVQARTTIASLRTAAGKALEKHGISGYKFAGTSLMLETTGTKVVIKRDRKKAEE